MKQLSISSARKQKGFTIVEVMLAAVLGIGAYLVVFGNFGSADAQTTSKNEIENLNALVPFLKGNFGSNQGNYTGLTNDVVRRIDGFPQQMEDPGTTDKIRHAWANDGIDLGVAGTSDEYFTILYKDVPGDACSLMLNKIYKMFVEVTVDGNPISGVANIATTCVPNPNNKEAPVDILFRGR